MSKQEVAINPLHVLPEEPAESLIRATPPTINMAAMAIHALKGHPVDSELNLAQ